MQHKILHCGNAKSGNYTIYKIVKLILRQNNLYSSFKEKTGIGKLIDVFCSEYTTFPEWGYIDIFFLQNNKLHIVFPSPKLRRLPVDEILFIKLSSLLWTHQHASIIKLPLLNDVTHGIYVLRDGRDVVNSFIHYNVLPERLKLELSYRYSSIDEIYSDLDLFNKYVTHWRDHVRSYLDNQSAFLCVRLEDIINKPSTTINKISRYLELPVSTEKIKKEIQFNYLAQKAPSHMRCGKIADWRNYYNQEHVQIFKDVAGDILVEAGYEKSKNW